MHLGAPTQEQLPCLLDILPLADALKYQPDFVGGVYLFFSDRTMFMIPSVITRIMALKSFLEAVNNDLERAPVKFAYTFGEMSRPSQGTLDLFDADRFVEAAGF